MSNQTEAPQPFTKQTTRRALLKKIGLASVAAVAAGSGIMSLTKVAQAVTEPDSTHSALNDMIATFFQKHYLKMDKEEVAESIARLERKYSRERGVTVDIDNSPPREGVVYGYALNLSKCKGYRRCVHACVTENNQSRDSEIQYIKVLEMNNGSMSLEGGDRYYDHETVPKEGKFYLPLQCMQCDNPPCVTACPTQATWMEPDGIVVVDYEWCIGCRYCMTACPYGARRFNWNEPQIPQEDINLSTHYLGNRPRPRGVVEKCTYCIQRTRKGRQPACQEACPTGARVFGNILDPNSEIRYVLENKTVFRLKEDLGTEPKFWYYTDT